MAPSTRVTKVTAGAAFLLGGARSSGHRVFMVKEDLRAAGVAGTPGRVCPGRAGQGRVSSEIAET